MKDHRISEGIKTALVCLLLVALVCLSAVYMFLFQQPTGSSFTEEDYRKLKNENTLYSYASYFDASLVCPAAIAVKSDYAGKPFLLTALSCVEPASRDLLSYYDVLLRDSAFVGSIPSEEGQDILRSVLTGDYLYVKYHTELSKSLIIRLSFPDRMAEEIGREPIYELFIFAVSDYLPVTAEMLGLELSGSYALCAVACDLSGNYYLYASEEVPQITGRSSFNISFYNAYSTFEKTDNFLFLMNTVYPQLIPEAFSGSSRAGRLMFFDRGLTLPAISCLSHYEELTAGENTSRLLSLFRMNPDKATAFFDKDKGITYVEGNLSLKLSSDGSCTFSALSPDAAPALLISQDTDDMLDYVGAGLYFLSSLPVFSTLTEAEDVSLVLTEFTSVDSHVRLSFGFNYRNTPVLVSGKHVCASFELYEGSISECFLSFCSPERREGEHVLSDNRLMLLTLMANDMGHSDVICAYSLDEAGLSEVRYCECFVGTGEKEGTK